jgi:hypothetical protein
VRHCEIFSDDDSICLKATRREPCEDIEVHDCVLGTECGALKLGTGVLRRHPARSHARLPSPLCRNRSHQTPQQRRRSF